MRRHRRLARRDRHVARQLAQPVHDHARRHPSEVYARLDLGRTVEAVTAALGQRAEAAAAVAVDGARLPPRQPLGVVRDQLLVAAHLSGTVREACVRVACESTVPVCNPDRAATHTARTAAHRRRMQRTHLHSRLAAHRHLRQRVLARLGFGPQYRLQQYQAAERAGTRELREHEAGAAKAVADAVDGPRARHLLQQLEDVAWPDLRPVAPLGRRALAWKRTAEAVAGTVEGDGLERPERRELWKLR
eukprot:979219-Prymnesium_polylepis.1